jgi:hypothetical protein
MPARILDLVELPGLVANRKRVAGTQDKFLFLLGSDADEDFGGPSPPCSAYITPKLPMLTLA